MRKNHSTLRLFALILLFALPALGCSMLTGDGVEESAPVEEQAAPTVESDEPALPEPMPSGIITNVAFSTEVEGDNYEPVGTTSVFAPAVNIIHCVVTVEDAPAGTAFKATWLTVDAAGIEPGYLIAETDVSTDGSRNIDFTFEPTTGPLPIGTYMVEIFVNGVLDQRVEFEVAE